MKYEFKIIYLGEYPGKWEDLLNEAGKSGWQLVQVIGGSGAIMARQVSANVTLDKTP